MPHQIRNIQAPYSSDAAFWDHYASPTPTLCLCLKITPRSYFGGAAAALGFTSHTRDLYLSAHSLNFKSKAALSNTVAELADGAGAAPNMELLAAFDDDAIKETDLLAGKWNGAEVELWLLNWAAPQMGEFVVGGGEVGEFRDYQTFFRAETTGYHERLQNNVQKVTARYCRVKEFGDNECKYNLAGTTPDGFSVTQTLTVANVASTHEIWFTRVQNVPDNFYEAGRITGVSGANSLVIREMKQSFGAGTSYVKIKLRERFPFTVSIGNQFTLIAGCNRTLERCVYFNNVINRRAEDWIMDIETISRVQPAS